MEPTIFQKSKVKVVCLNVQPTVLLPGMKVGYSLIPVEEHLAGLILKLLQRVKFKPKKAACEDCEPGIPFTYYGCRVGFWGGRGVNCLDHYFLRTGLML